MQVATLTIGTVISPGTILMILVPKDEIFRKPWSVPYYPHFYRIVVVVRHPHTLDAFIPSTRIKLLRKFGIFLMGIGLIGSLALFFIKPLALGIFGKPGDAGGAFFVVGLFVYLISSAGLLGLFVFEASRLFGFEHQHKNEHAGAPITVPVTPPITPNLNIKHPRSAA